MICSTPCNCIYFVGWTWKVGECNGRGPAYQSIIGCELCYCEECFGCKVQGLLLFGSPIPLLIVSLKQVPRAALEHPYTQKKEGEEVKIFSGTARTQFSFLFFFLISFSHVQWAVNKLKKPIVTINWLQQCWKEHRLVPQESFKVLPFSGLTICVTRIPIGWQPISHYNSNSFNIRLSLMHLFLYLRWAERDGKDYLAKWRKILSWADQKVLTFNLQYILFVILLQKEFVL